MLAGCFPHGSPLFFFFVFLTQTRWQEGHKGCECPEPKSPDAKMPERNRERETGPPPEKQGSTILEGGKVQ
jgi:hypothetical protein